MINIRPQIDGNGIEKPGWPASSLPSIITTTLGLPGLFALFNWWLGRALQQDVQAPITETAAP